ncbi:MAG TPA: hypothetical protein VEG30_15640 [Terriglobales bacterium]|nr:hypothetical protein [Terriglobales bacterium]
MDQKNAFGLARSVSLTLMLLGAALTVWGESPEAQSGSEAPTSLTSAIHDLEAQIQQLRTDLQEVRQDAARSHADTVELRRELEATRTELIAISAHPQPSIRDQEARSREADAAESSSSLESVKEDVQLLRAKVDEQYQTKVESASKYRVRLSGLVLLNLFGNVGTVDNIENPALAEPQSIGKSNGSFSGTLRQTQLGLEVFGPTIAGARLSGNVQMDFAGEFAPVPGGINMGLMRFRTGFARLDWARTSIIAGQDRLFFIPESPTSFASLETPALAYSGNLWAWTPQVRVEHRFRAGSSSDITVSAGLLDPVTGEPPGTGYTRKPEPGEASGIPAFAGHVAWSHSVFDRQLTIGGAGYTSRQDWGFDRIVQAWMGSADWNLPLRQWLELSGSFYRGNSIGGLNGGLGRSALWSGFLSNPATYVAGLDTIGGWAQLKIRPAPKWELNTAFGQDNPFASQLRAYPGSPSYLDTSLARNRTAFTNVIYRPRSDLLFSAEYRHLTSFPIQGAAESANHINLAMGVLF